jgi:hypothetical protein
MSQQRQSRPATKGGSADSEWQGKAHWSNVWSRQARKTHAEDSTTSNICCTMLGRSSGGARTITRNTRLLTAAIG